MFKSNKNKYNSIIFEKLEDRKYMVSFTLENENIDSSTVNEFSLLELLYNSNNEQFIDKCIQYNENNGIIYILIKPICKEFGFNSRYLYFSLEKKIQDDKKVELQFNPIHVSNLDYLDQKYHHYLKDDSIIPTSIIHLNATFEKINNHQMLVEFTYNLDPAFYIFPLFESILKIVLKKIFKNLQICYKLIR
jgi:hypothetical protein